jgi:L-ascorbate metabolism protein UlaG (beta-lactamase superfamily)
MKLQLIRNATLKLHYAGRCILIDPYFAPRHSLPSYAGRSANPLVELPYPINDILDGVELVIVSHLHSDHFDSVAKARLPKHMPILCQPGDEGEIRSSGFTNVTPLLDAVDWQGIGVMRCEASHGLGPVVETMGPVMGLMITSPKEPSLYWMGDTVLYPPVLETIARHRPDIVVCHACGATWDGDLIVMDARQISLLIETMMADGMGTVIVATHMDALDHATVTRDDLRDGIRACGLPAERLLVPEDGAILDFVR